MVTFLILFLILLIATAFYLTFTNKKNGQINKRKVNSKNSVSNKLSYKKSIYTDRVDQMDENHPLQELSNISESFDKYNNDSSVAQSDSGELFIKTKTNLLNLHVDAMIQAANTFKPCDQISMLNLNDQLHTITAEIIEQINKLTIDPSQILVISKKIEALALIEEYLVNLTNTYEKLVNKELTEESFKEMIEDTLGVAPSSELGRSEYKKFLDF